MPRHNESRAERADSTEVIITVERRVIVGEVHAGDGVKSEYASPLHAAFALVADSIGKAPNIGAVRGAPFPSEDRIAFTYNGVEYVVESTPGELDLTIPVER